MLSGILSVLWGQRWKPGMMRGPCPRRRVCPHGAPGLSRPLLTKWKEKGIESPSGGREVSATPTEEARGRVRLAVLLMTYHKACLSPRPCGQPRYQEEA